MILGGDIGGTKTLLALARSGGNEPAILCERRYESRDWADFATLLRAFLDEAGATGEIAAACIGVAGPVEDNRAQVTYLPWVVDGRALAQAFGLGRVEVVNDFAAAAQGVAALRPGDLATLQEGRPLAGSPRLLIGAGTGLGVAALVPEGGGWRTIAGEGGHIGFSPADEEQLAVWRHLARPGGRVTAENVISGPGLAAIYECLGKRSSVSVEANARGAGVMPELKRSSVSVEANARGAGVMPELKVSPRNTAIADPAEIVAAAPDSPLAGRALDLFIAAYGAFAGDLALLFMARGGVYLGGGIAPKILPRLQQGGFVRAFGTRGAHAHLMADFPIRVVTVERLGLLGALSIAAAHTKDS